MSRGGGVIEINGSSDYNTQLAKAGKKLVVVDFYATWCGPCKVIAPAFDALASRYANRAVFLRVDVDKNSDVSRAAGVTGMPTFHFIHCNQTLESFSGADQSKLESTVERLVQKYSQSFLQGQGAGTAGADEGPIDERVGVGRGRINPWADRSFVPPGMRALNAEAKAAPSSSPPSSSSTPATSGGSGTTPNSTVAAARADRASVLTSSVPAVAPSSSSPSSSDTGTSSHTPSPLETSLTEMGFPSDRARAAIIMGKCTDIESAIVWLTDPSNENVTAPPVSTTPTNTNTPTNTSAGTTTSTTATGDKPKPNPLGLTKEELDDIALLKSVYNMKDMTLKQPTAKPSTTPSSSSSSSSQGTATGDDSKAGEAGTVLPNGHVRTAQEEAIARRRAEYWQKKSMEEIEKTKRDYESKKAMAKAQEELAEKKAQFDKERAEAQRKKELAEKEASKKRMAALLAEEKKRRAEEAEQRRKALEQLMAQRNAQPK